MQKSNLLFVVIFLLLNIVTHSQSKFIGKWLGELDIHGTKLRVVFNISESAEQVLKATLDSPDQSAFDIPVSEVSENGNTLLVKVKMIGASYEGNLVNDSTIVGEFNQGGMSFDITFKKTDVVKEKVKYQEPTKPYPYNEEEVKIENKEAKITLAGTLTLPKTVKKHPAVILVSGSGPQDRNEALLGHKPFLVLADYLTRLGFVVLRYDDRGVAQSTGDFSKATSLDFVTDALSAIKYLQTREEVDIDKIGIIGHSEGGLIAPIAASTSEEVKFIVLLAGTGVTGEEIIYEQTKAINKSSGLSEEFIHEYDRFIREMLPIVINAGDEESARVQLREYLNKQLQQLSDTFKREAQLDSSSIEMTIQRSVNPWFRLFLTLDPQDYLKKVKVPVLAINGSKDIQVIPSQNLPKIEEALKESGNNDFIVMELEGLNHLFQKCTACTFAEYSTLEETFSPDALKVVGDWLKGRFLK
ncbi:MAG TPA: alpha/beta fold hydrolase [Ignavibacteriaceae bacterium]|nr:alpha/beta fold hydrolase [Ignavibacteriaceae bacterium]